MLVECRRLLGPCGITLHDGSPMAGAPPGGPYDIFMGGWFGRNINEPYGTGFDTERDGAPDGDAYLKGQMSGHGYVGAVKL